MIDSHICSRGARTVTDADDDFTPPPPRPRFRKVRAAAKWFFGALALIALVLLAGRWQTGRFGQRQLGVTVQRLDAEDPNWRLDGVMEEWARTEPHDKAAPDVLTIAKGIPQEFREWQTSGHAGPLYGQYPSNRLPRAGAIEAARKPARASLLVRTEALKLRELKTGRYVFEIPDNPYSLVLPHINETRQLTGLLRLDGQIASIEKNPNRGISAARAQLGVARSFGPEPLLISQLSRMAIASSAAQTTAQVLAWGEPTEGLAELQTELLAEADVPWFRTGIRGERAVVDKVFTAMENGTVAPETYLQNVNGVPPGPGAQAALRAYRPLIPGDHAKCLQLLTLYCEAAKLPHHEQLAALRAVPLPGPPPGEIRYMMTRHLLPACERVAGRGLSARAELLAAAACVACERFRHKNARFPHNLAELVPEFLPAVPLGPFDGLPLRYRSFPDRIAIFSFQPGGSVLADTQPEEFRTPDATGPGLGYVVWAPNQRGLPAVEEHAP